MDSIIYDHMLKGFRDFLMRGNIVDLAVAVVIGGAFNGIVNALVKDLIMPLPGVFGGKPNFSGFYVTLGNSKFMVGDFLNALLSFLIVAGAIYFVVVVPMNKIAERVKKGEKAGLAEKNCPECLSAIPIGARRCRFCTTVVGK